MQLSFLENLILHIEDDDRWIRQVHSVLNRPGYGLPAVYGARLTHTLSDIKYPLCEAQLTTEFSRLTEGITEIPTLVSIVSAQIARAFLGRYVPSTIISDSSFPMNGKQIVGWLCEHGFNDYAFIGLSGTPFTDLDPDLQQWFGMSNARYFQKQDFGEQEEIIVQQVIRNRADNIRTYQHFK